MSNARIILGAVGPEDKYLIDNTKNTFFKKSYKRYTYFGMNWSVISNDDNPTYYASGSSFNPFCPNSKTYFRVPFAGDLIVDAYLRLKINEGATSISCENVGKFTAATIVKSIRMKYNNKIISELDNNYIMLHQKLFSSDDDFTRFYKMSSYSELVSSTNASNTFFDPTFSCLDDRKAGYLYLPLPFWFTKTPGSAFPLWALTDPNIGFEVELADYNNWFNGTGTIKVLDIQLLLNYAFLTQEEQVKFKNLPLEYLIEQVETVEKTKITGNNCNKKVVLPQTNFIRYLVWNLLPFDTDSSPGCTDTTIIGDNGALHQFDSQIGVNKTTISFNGNPVLVDAPSYFTTQITRYMNFTNPGIKTHECSTFYGSGGAPCKINNYDCSPGCADGADCSPGCYENDCTRDINVHTYSFALEPMNYKDSGFVSTEKFTHSEMELSINPPSGETNMQLCVYLVKHNIIRFENGSMSIVFN